MSSAREAEIKQSKLIYLQHSDRNGFATNILALQMLAAGILISYTVHASPAQSL
jgi:hypothetical protein